MAQDYRAPLAATFRASFHTSIYELWEGAFPLREAIDLAKVASEDTTTYLGAAMAGMTAPASPSDLANTVLAIRIAGQDLNVFLPFPPSEEEPAPAPAAEEIQRAELALENSVIFS